MGERRFHGTTHWRGGFDQHLIRRATLDEQVRMALGELKELDPNWEAWYDDNDNVPEWGTSSERLRILRERIDDLRKQGVREDGSQAGFSQLKEIGFGPFGPM
jgi:hypothetical protein